MVLSIKFSGLIVLFSFMMMSIYDIESVPVELWLGNDISNDVSNVIPNSEDSLVPESFRAVEETEMSHGRQKVVLTFEDLSFDDDFISSTGMDERNEPGVIQLISSDSRQSSLKSVDCGEDEFRCKVSGECIPMFLRCDESDEEDCVCPATQVRCLSGFCEANYDVCEQYEGCRWTSLGYLCEKNCTQDEFRCSSRECTTKGVCDSKRDCTNGMDEKLDICQMTRAGLSIKREIYR